MKRLPLLLLLLLCAACASATAPAACPSRVVTTGGDTLVVFCDGVRGPSNERPADKRPR